MLYVYYESDKEYISYRNQDKMNEICQIQQSITDCLKAFHTLEIVGLVCFFLICLSLGL